MDTERRRALIVDAFTDEPLSGNPAGVVPDAEGLAADQMQAIARELNASETVFLLPDDDADRRARYFTPTREVELCGHATVASHALLAAEGVIEDGDHSLATGAGTIDVTVEGETVWMGTTDPEVREVDLEYERVADALGVDVAALRDVGADLPLSKATTGLWYLMVPVNFLEHLGGMEPDMAAIEALSEELGVTGVYAFTFDTVSEATLHGRMFAPAAGVPEDPVTGTASGAVAAYVRRHGALGGDIDEELRFEQGHFIDRPGLVRVRAEEEIRVGGSAVEALDGQLRIPPASEDEILEP
jgi:PhzF family phenazine biosynthesis protein